jgi:hypothetical protein
LKAFGVYSGGGYASELAFHTSNGTTLSQKMLLDNLGNLGLGVTPSAWWSGSKAIQVGNGASFEGRTGSNIASMGSNYFLNASGVSTYISSAAATQYYQSAGQHIWQTAASGNAGDPISFTQAMTLDASGRLQIGGTTAYDSAMLSITTPSQTFSFIADGGTTSNKSRGGFFHPSVNVFALNVDGASGILAFTQNGTERARITSDGTLRIGDAPAGNSLQFGSTSGGVYTERARIGLESTTALAFKVGSTSVDAMRITSGGDLLVGTTDSGSGATAAKQRIIGAAANNLYLGSTSAGGWRITSDALNDGGTFYHIKFTENGTERGSITSNGTITTYNTTSDYRLKTVIGPVANAGQRIDALQPVEYTWNADGSRTRGFLAHQFQEVYASSVSGTKDAVDAEGKPVYQAMQASTSEVIADLVAEIQSLRARVAALESQA